MSYIFRGTTPSIVLNVNKDYSLTDLKQVWVTFKSKINQVPKIEVTYDISDVIIDSTENTITINMSQEETLAFKGLKQVECQVRFLKNDDRADASITVDIDIYRILKEGVIG